MWQNSANQRGNPLSYLAQIDNGDQQQNVSGSGRLNRGVSYASMVSGAAVSVNASVDPDVGRVETGEASNSRVAQIGYGNSFLSQEIVSQTRNHSVEIDALIRTHDNSIRQGVEQSLNRYWLSRLHTLQQTAIKAIMEKQAEVDNASGRNSELEERISKFSSDNQILFNLVRQLQSVASKLKADLRNVLNQNTAAAAAAAPPLAVESCDDNGLAPFVVNDEQSCYIMEDASVESSQEKVHRRLICKVCLVKEISFVVLHCRHLCLCDECESKVDVCPVCNSLKVGTAQIFIP